MLCPSRAALARRSGARAGQVLLIAVMLMTAILLMGTLFVAIVSYNQSLSGRHAEMLLARSLAEAGIRYASYMLEHSPLGADWRPPKPPYMYSDGSGAEPGFYGPDRTADTEDDYYLPQELVRGYHGLIDPNTGEIHRIGFTRYPDPLGKAPNLAPAELREIGRGHVLLRVTYDPDPPYEPGDTPTPQGKPESRYIKIEAIGVAETTGVTMYRMVAYKPIGLTDYLIWVTDRTDTGKVAYLGFSPWIDFDNSGGIDVHPGPDIFHRGEFLAQRYFGPIRANTHLQLVGGNLSGNPLSGGLLDPAQASNQISLATSPLPPPYGNGYLRDDAVEVAAGISDPVQGAPGAPVPGQSTAVEELSWNGASVQSTGPMTVWPSDDPRFSTHGGRVLDGQEGLDAQGEPRFVTDLPAPDIFAADPNTGVDRYRALTRDSGVLNANGENTGIYGHGKGIYVDNYGDLQFVRSDGTHDLDALLADWLRQIPEGDPRAADSGWNAMYTLYVPPGVEIELYDTYQATVAGKTPTTDPALAAANPDTHIWWPDYDAVRQEPGIKLIRHDKTWRDADGNDTGLNVMYRYYPSYPNCVIFCEGNVRVRGALPPSTQRRYDLVIVSGGTIYIDGQILSPMDTGAAADESENTRVVLLARDHVCLNTTMIVPQLTSGQVPAAPDDPANPDPDKMHWALSPGGGQVLSSFMFGGPPAGDVRLHVKHTAADPGPSGMSMVLRNYNPAFGAVGSILSYDFQDADPTTAPNAFVYAFAPLGVPLPGPGTNTIAPNWELARFGVGGYLSANPGEWNFLALQFADPGLAPGSTDYWVKVWKVQEWAVVGGQARPVGSIHAKVNAIIYAQNGCWFVIPGNYFDPDATANDMDGNGIPDAVENRRYNYEITVVGAITQNYTAPPEAVREWMDKWAYPVWDASGLCWASIRYVYDEAIRAGRDQPPGGIVGNSYVSARLPTSLDWNLPKLPLLPTCPTLIYTGQAY